MTTFVVMTDPDFAEAPTACAVVATGGRAGGTFLGLVCGCGQTLEETSSPVEVDEMLAILDRLGLEHATVTGCACELNATVTTDVYADALDKHFGLVH